MRPTLTPPLTRDLVLVGGGHAHALILRQWGMAPVPGVRLTLIDPEPAAAYSGMLPGYVAGHYTRQELEIDLVRLARFAGAALILQPAIGLDPDNRLIHLPDRPPMAWDLLSLDIGVTSAMPALPGFTGHGVAAKPLGPFASRWAAFVEEVAAGRAPPHCAILGAGVAGVELSMAIAFRLRGVSPAEPKVTLIERGRALAGSSSRAVAQLRKHLERQGISLLEETEATAIGAEAVTLADAPDVPSRFTVGTAGAHPHGWLAKTGLHLTDGFLTVDASLRSVSHPAVYAAGDCAHLSHAPRPKAGVYAVRAAEVLGRNLRADLTGTSRESYHPQQSYLKLISLGAKSALAGRGALALAGPPMWRWKDRIDRNFMNKLNDLPSMPAPLVPRGAAQGVATAMAGRPLCGGCGAKLGAAALAGGLAGLPPARRNDVESRPGDDAAILRAGEGRQVITTDHLRAFVADPWAMARLTAIHAMGDVWAMGAAPQAALATVILPPMAPELQARTLKQITQGAAEVFRGAGADLVGGHSTQGPEMVIGFTVTGLAKTPVTLAGARPGDALILTKALGTGVLLAAEMAGRAQGRWIADLLDAMARPMTRDAEILGPVAHAMTDVTGFGLAGHALAMAAASGVALCLDFKALPWLDGALECAGRGVASSIQAANADHAGPRMRGFAPGPEAALLHDPQTCGGLLAAVPAEMADGLIAQLREAGAPAARIGEVRSGAPGLSPP